jgi:predicted N-acyltransferase
MTYRGRIHEAIDQADQDEWNHVCAAGGGHVFTSPALLAAVESSMAPTCRFWHVLLHDVRGTPMACATYSTFRLDIADTVEPSVKPWVVAVRRALPRLTYLRLLIGGLPLSAGQSNIIIGPQADWRCALETFDDIAVRLAAQERAQLIVYKEFGAGDLARTDALLERGYRRAATPPMFHFNPQFPDLAGYTEALTAHYRRLVRLSTRKLEASGLTTSCLTDPAAILEAYTPRVHDLYVAVAKKSNIRLELHGIEFFRALVRHLPEAVSLIALSRQGEILAFMWGLTYESVYHSLFCGVDYGRNEQYDLYFNLEYATIDFAMRQRVADIQLGQTADVFKSRLGCYTQPRYVYARGVGRIAAMLVRRGLETLLPPPQEPPRYRVFKADQDDRPRRAPAAVG